MFARLSVAQRIYGAFAALVVLIIVVGGAGYYGVVAINGLFGGFRGAASQTHVIDEIVDDVTTLRMLDASYRIAGSEEVAAEFAAAVSAAEQQYAVAEAAFAGSSAALEIIAAVKAKSVAFAAAFSRGVELQATREALLDEMQGHATASRNGTSEILASSATAGHTASAVEAGKASDAILQMLLHGERYLLAADPLDFERLQAFGAEARAALADLVAMLEMFRPELAATAKRAASGIDPYLAAAQRLKAATVEQNALRMEGLDVFGPQMQADLATLQERVVERRQALGSAGDAQAQTASLVLLGVGGFAVLLGLALAFLIGSWLSRTIRGMAGDMRRLADGDLELELSGSSMHNELGQMALALETFRTNGKAVRAMDQQKAETARDEAARRAVQDDLQNEVQRVVGAAVAGDFTARIERHFDAADLDALVAGINELMETVDRGLSETGAVLAAFARADLTQRMSGEYCGSFGTLKDDLNLAADTFSEIVAELQATSRSLRTATGELLSGANDLSERTTKQAATIEQTSAAVEQMSGNVAANAETAEEASSKTQTASYMANEGGQAMTEATAAMERITESSGKISNIIGLIDDIAFQTNLLALNASVEAARAGEAGKGFAVVAIEVRRLAQSAAVASSEIKGLIEQSASEVAGGSRLVQTAAAKLAAILDAVKENSVLMQGISVASREQAAAINEVNSAVRQMDEMTQQNAALVEETNAAIEQTEAQAAELDRIVESFTVGEKAAAPVTGAARRQAGRVADVFRLDGNAALAVEAEGL